MSRRLEVSVSSRLSLKYANAENDCDLRGNAWLESPGLLVRHESQRRKLRILMLIVRRNHHQKCNITLDDRDNRYKMKKKQFLWRLDFETEKMRLETPKGLQRTIWSSALKLLLNVSAEEELLKMIQPKRTINDDDDALDEGEDTV